MYPVGLAPAGSGLYVSFHGRNTFPYQIGIARISESGDVVWKHFDNAHHWITVGPKGNVYAPSMRILKAPEQFGDSGVNVRCDRNVYNEGVRIYSPTGEILRELSILDLYEKSDLPGLYYSIQNDCDPVHLNSVDVATAAIAARNPLVDEGDILVSIREPSAIALISQKTGAIKKIHIGRTAAQHSANFLPDGNILVFDNQGGDRDLGGTRMARVNIETGEVSTVYPTRADQPFVPVASGDGGQIDVSADGTRALMSLKTQSRVVEIDLASGEPLWTMEFAFDFSDFLEQHHIKAQTPKGYFRPYGVYYVDPASFGLPALKRLASSAG
ncbi:MAG: arylsulfotransferase family protein [Parvularculaceae bacterium]